MFFIILLFSYKFLFVSTMLFNVAFLFSFLLIFKLLRLLDFFFNTKNKMQIVIPYTNKIIGIKWLKTFINVLVLSNNIV